MGFFFYLDVVSTLSLILDVSWLGEILFCQGDDDAGGGNAIRASRASRAGTRAARVVRIIRLIRIIKLYKAIQDAKAKKARLEAMERARANGEDVDEWLFDTEDDQKSGE